MLVEDLATGRSPWLKKLLCLQVLLLLFWGPLGSKGSMAQTADPIQAAKQQLQEKLKRADKERTLPDQLKEIIALLAAKPKPTQTALGGTRDEDQAIGKKVVDDFYAMLNQFQYVLSPAEILFIESKFYIKHGWYNHAKRLLEEAQKMAPDNILIRQTMEELEKVTDSSAASQANE